VVRETGWQKERGEKKTNKKPPPFPFFSSSSALFSSLSSFLFSFSSFFFSSSTFPPFLVHLFAFFLCLVCVMEDLVKCKTCQLEIPKKKLRYHQELHQNEGEITVPSWVQGAELRDDSKHWLKFTRAQDEGDIKGRFACPLCPTTFPAISALRTHIWNQHQNRLVQVEGAEIPEAAPVVPLVQEGGVPVIARDEVRSEKSIPTVFFLLLFLFFSLMSSFFFFFFFFFLHFFFFLPSSETRPSLSGSETKVNSLKTRL